MKKVIFKLIIHRLLIRGISGTKVVLLWSQPLLSKFILENDQECSSCTSFLFNYNSTNIGRDMTSCNFILFYSAVAITKAGSLCDTK